MGRRRSKEQLLKDSLARRNKKKSRTGFMDEDGAWYILDNAATIMTQSPSIEHRLKGPGDKALRERAIR